MEHVISVLFQRNGVGTITFDPSPKELKAHRTAGGFAVEFPMTLRLGMNRSQLPQPQPLLSNISATLFLGTDRIGEARCEGHLFFGSQGGDGADVSGASASLVWTDVITALPSLEQLRGERPLQLTIELRAELCYLLPSSGPRVRSEPCSVYGTAHVTYATQVWATMLRNLGVVDYVFAQVPLPSDPPAGWDGVWRELSRARDARDVGGDAGWSGCVVAVRRALEAWQKIEPEKQWPTTREERETLTKKERLACLRWSLHQAAHPAAHTGEDEWFKADAQFMLVTLCGLLAARS